MPVGILPIRSVVLQFQYVGSPQLYTVLILVGDLVLLVECRAATEPGQPICQPPGFAEADLQCEVGDTAILGDQRMTGSYCYRKASPYRAALSTAILE